MRLFVAVIPVSRLEMTEWLKYAYWCCDILTLTIFQWEAQNSGGVVTEVNIMRCILVVVGSNLFVATWLIGANNQF